MAPSSIATASAHASAKETMENDTVKESNKLKAKIKELSRIMSKLKQLRDLRRKKLELKGHFFADDGDRFFNQ
ncbi:hypothetical protein ABG067_009188, partial [Albugo candida]